MVASDQPVAAAVTFRSVLRVREFRLLWLADAQSLLGDQLARVALAVLVYDRTASGLATAAVYALTFLPALFGNLLLGHLADQLPRRGLLVAGDLTRMVLLAVMAVPGVPLVVLAALLVGAVTVGTPWKAAESSLVVDLVEATAYPVGMGCGQPPRCWSVSSPAPRRNQLRRRRHRPVHPARRHSPRDRRRQQRH